LGIGEFKEVADNAFSESVLADKGNSLPLKVGGNRLIVIRINQHEPPRQRTFEEVRDTLAQELRQEGARQKLEQQTRRASAELDKGRSAEQVAGEVGGILNASGWVTRDDAKLSAPVLAEAFRMPRPSGKPTHSVVATPEGAAVVILEAVEDGTLQNAQPAELATLRQTLEGRATGAEFEAYKASLYREFDPQINEDQL
jgi:peptidyl-prolyl cis-trans isomerase D